tara:strand:+ start:31 stop:216 length:186 start_codon:yes stop_codon:yes gene_type:complete
MDLMEILTTVTTVVTVASAVCAVTPTAKDDQFMGKYVYPFLEALALNIGKAKDAKPKEEIL